MLSFLLSHYPPLYLGADDLISDTDRFPPVRTISDRLLCCELFANLEWVSFPKFLVTLHEPPAEGIAANQNSDVGPGTINDRHVVLNLQLVFVWDSVFPFTSFVCRDGFVLKDARSNIWNFTGSIQIRQYEGVLPTLEGLLELADPNPGALGELSPNKGFQLRP